MKLIIRRPETSDTKAIEALFAETLRENFDRNAIHNPGGTLMRSELEKLCHELQIDLQSNGRVSHHLVAELDGTVVGTIAYGAPNRHIRQHCDASAGLPEIKSVYIHPGQQGNGIGSKLLQAICQTLHESGQDSFCLDCGYATAQGFWCNVLGDPAVSLPDYWGPGQYHMIWIGATKDHL